MAQVPVLPALTFPCNVQAQAIAHTGNPDPWQVAQYEAALAAGDAPSHPPADLNLYKEMELIMEPETEASSDGSTEETHLQQ